MFIQVVPRSTLTDAAAAPSSTSMDHSRQRSGVEAVSDLHGLSRKFQAASASGPKRRTPAPASVCTEKPAVLDQTYDDDRQQVIQLQAEAQDGMHQPPACV